MIDTQAAGQAFEREMQAKEQAKPIRQAGTRRTSELDSISTAGATRLANVIRQFWRLAGFDPVIEVVRIGGTSDAPTYGVRSDLINGLPAAAPTKEARDGHG